MPSEFDKKPLGNYPNSDTEQRVFIPQSPKNRFVKQHWYTVPDAEGRQGMHGNMMGDGDFSSDAWGNYVDME